MPLHPTPPQATECRKKDSDAAGPHKAVNQPRSALKVSVKPFPKACGSRAEPLRGRGQSLVRREATTPALHKKRVGKRSSFPALFYVDKPYPAPEKGVLLHSQETATRGSVFPSPDELNEERKPGPCPASCSALYDGAESQQRITPVLGGFPVGSRNPSEMHFSLRSARSRRYYSFFASLHPRGECAIIVLGTMSAVMCIVYSRDSFSVLVFVH